mmetsp:Transcript_17656/g.31933  ORF Transcript_17656/g.31933 Transcript_17656/m.31933 type:complete len:246 (-) Transcript_17656:1237-1974(-)
MPLLALRSKDSMAASKNSRGGSTVALYLPHRMPLPQCLRARSTPGTRSSIPRTVVPEAYRPPLPRRRARSRIPLRFRCMWTIRVSKRMASWLWRSAEEPWRVAASAGPISLISALPHSNVPRHLYHRSSSPPNELNQNRKTNLPNSSSPSRCNLHTMPRHSFRSAISACSSDPYPLDDAFCSIWRGQRDPHAPGGIGDRRSERGVLEGCISLARGGSLSWWSDLECVECAMWHWPLCEWKEAIRR